jgi:hypothetical protein
MKICLDCNHFTTNWVEEYIEECNKKLSLLEGDSGRCDSHEYKPLNKTQNV